MKKRVCSILLSLAMVLAMMPTMAVHVSAATVYDVSSGNVVISSNGDYTITGTTTSNTITVKTGVIANITLDGVNINVSGTEKACAFALEGTANATITLNGENILKSGKYRAGLYVPYGATVNIGGTGNLTAEGISTAGGNTGAGIGGDCYFNNNSADDYETGTIGNGTINITAGTITATGYGNAAGIGYGTGNHITNGDIPKSSGPITISGGTVIAKGDWRGAGIGGSFITGVGGGPGCSVTISGSTTEVTATGGTGAAGIGAGSGSTNDRGSDEGTLTVKDGLVVKGGTDAASAQKLTDFYSSNRTKYMIVKASPTYAITYNKGTGTGELPANGIKTEGTDYTVSTSYPLTKEGYKQIGWKLGSESTDGTGAVTTLTDDAAVTLYPVWEIIEPTISTQPASSSVTYGTGAELSVSATVATGTLSYQWYNNTTNSNTGGAVIDGAKGSSYTTPETKDAGNYYYYCVVTANEQSVTSNVATVTVSAKGVNIQVTNDSNKLNCTYAGGTFGVTDLFTIDPDPGNATYSIENGGTGTGEITPKGVLTVTKAGTFNIKVATGGGNYAATSATATLTVNKGGVTVPTIESKTYTGENLTAGISPVSGESGYSVTTNVGGIRKGEYDVVLKLNKPELYQWSDDTTTADKTLKFNITQATNNWTKSLSCDGFTYDGTKTLAPSATATFGAVTYTYSTASDGNYSTIPDGVIKNAGTYYVKANVEGTDNYTGLTSEPFKVTIAKAPVSFTVSNNSYNYNTLAHTATVTQTAGQTPSVAGKFNVTYQKDTETAAVEEKNVGEYKIIVSLTDTNYKFDGQADTERSITLQDKLTIFKVSYPGWESLTLPTAGDLTYGQKLSDSGLMGVDTGCTYAWKTGTEIPTVTNNGYTVVCTPINTNYFTFERTVPITVSKATPTLTMPEASAITYGQTLESSTLTGGSAVVTYNDVANTNVPGNFTWDNTTTVPQVSDSKKTEYQVTFTPTDTDNYNKVTDKITVTVAPKPVDLTWDYTKAFTYDGTEKKVAVTGVSNKVGNDAFIFAYSDNSKTNAGSYTANVTALGNPNYTLSGGTKVSESWVIDKATLNVTPEDGQNKAAGKPDPTLEYSYSNNITGETPTFTGVLERAAGETAGSYDITQGSLKLTDDAVNANYELNFVTGKKFEIKATYAVALNGNGGSGSPLTTYTNGTGATLPDDWTKAKYTFMGWYDNADFTGDPVKEISKTAIGDKTFYAKWKSNIPPVPRAVKAKAKDRYSVKVSWKKSTGATSYKVYKATKKTGKYKLVGKVKSTSKTVKKLKANKKYWFKIKAVNSSGASKSSIAASVKTKKEPVSFTVKNTKGTSVKVHWKTVKGAEGYQVANDHTANGRMKTYWTGKNSVNTFTSGGKTIGKTYKFKMRYYKVKNGKKVYSSWTKAKTIKVR
ncbi:MAG: InlB B-repeat-containing protein [Eubacteriaceae bacterium]|nr:InlB B-repeat-containing protein [Eubacteriaceae bacterium]